MDQMYEDPVHTSFCIGASLHWCNRLMSKRDFLELITTILDPSVWVSDDDDIEWKTQQFISISYLSMRLLDEIEDEIIRDIVINIAMDTNHPLSLIKSLSTQKVEMPLNGKLYFLKICSQVMGFRIGSWLPSMKEALTILRLELSLREMRHGGRYQSLIVFRILKKDRL